MILAKVHTGIFGKTVSDMTRTKDLGDGYWLIRKRVYHYHPNGMQMWLDGEKSVVDEGWYSLVGKKQLSEMGRFDLVDLANYNVGGIRVSDL